MNAVVELDSVKKFEIKDAAAQGYEIHYFGLDEVKQICDGVDLTVTRNKDHPGVAFILIGDLKNTKWYPLKKILENKKLIVKRVEVNPQMLMNFIISGSKEKSGIDYKTTSTEKALFGILKDSKAYNASDIHVHIEGACTKIYFRIDSKLRLMDAYTGPQALGASIGQAIFTSLPKVTGNESSGDYAGKEQPLSATFNDDDGGRWRAGLYPGDEGPRIAIRELGKRSETYIKLPELGLSPLQIAAIKSALMNGKGMFLITGPTSSGKSTTLSSLLSMLNETGGVAIYTIEDPVERVLPGTAQATTNESKKTADELAKQLLRQDPDVIGYGELRTKEMVASSVRMSTTGHLVLGTFHTNGAVECVSSLEGELGVSLHRLATPGFLKGSMYQELVGKPCGKCCLSYDDAKKNLDPFDAERIKRRFGDDVNRFKFINEEGCGDCLNTGVKGKTAIAEVVPIDIKACRFISNRDMLGWKEYLREKGWPMIRDHAISKVVAGELDIFSCEKIVGSLTSDPMEEFDLEELKRLATYEPQ